MGYPALCPGVPETKKKKKKKKKMLHHRLADHALVFKLLI